MYHLEKELQEITEKITNLKIKQNKEWIWSGQQLSHRKVTWQAIKNDIQKKIELIKQNYSEEDKVFLISKLSSQLTRAEEQISKVEVDLTYLKSLERWITFAIAFLCLLIIAYFVFLVWLENR
ncbi:hypothetical protein [endosymbiont GvMRE of Glomus versiforme]|uniref:hypothetical protein n=1 Tax=endosymbiont GvMRE of Glomus versiforme TaxID=2039283 RepID=UPI000EE765E4|nr:hypothetical protein [endosymbiont GvMRE of Glomus versiforme]RHZ35674.1 hypothetical protein GvMRE_IIg26 [endosymbiont GvMRE of Glomus versiforme]